MLLEVVVDAEQHSFIRAMGILLWLLMVIFFSPLLPLLTVYPSWSHDTLVLICIALCAVAYAYFLMRLPWTCASRKTGEADYLIVIVTILSLIALSELTKNLSRLIKN